MRKWLRVLHRWLGLVVLGFLILAGATGSLLAFEHELDQRLNPRLLLASWQGSALQADVLISRIEAQDARLRVSLLPLDTQPGHAAEVQVQGSSTTQPLGFDRLFVNPSTGEILGHRTWGAWQLDAVHLMPLVNRFHRSLTLPGRWGHWLMGSMALLWLLLSVMGGVLSLPQNRPARAALPQSQTANFWQRWKPAWQIKRGAKGFRLAFDIHRAVGLWTLPLFVLLAFSGASLNLSNEVFKPVLAWIGKISPHPASSLPAQLPGLSVDTRMNASIALEKARALLPRQALDFEPWYISYLPRSGVYRVAFKEPGFREKMLSVRYEQVFMDAHSGQLAALFGYDSGTGADRFLVWQYPLHSGKALGLSGRIAMCLAGLLLTLVCATGLVHWGLRRSAVRR